LPKDIPSKPNRTFKDKGWKSLGDWLGTGTVAPRLREYRPFEKARKFARSLGLKSGKEWQEFCKGQLPEKGTLPKDIPASPNNPYRDEGWINWGDWLGTGTIALWLREYRSFEEARAYVQSLGLSGKSEWDKYCKNKLPE
jgi:hypothetical protein